MITLEQNNVMQVPSLKAKPRQLKDIWAKPESLGELQRSEIEPKWRDPRRNVIVHSLGKLRRCQKRTNNNLLFPSKEESSIC